MRVADREKSAPSTNTGSNSRAPLLNCLMSKLPPFSRGGIVRNASDAIGSEPGTAPCGLGRQRNAAAGGKVSLAAPDGLAQFLRGGDADDPDKRAVGNAHIRKLGRLGKAVLDRPFGDIGVGERVAQKAKARHLHSVAEIGRLHVADLDFEQVARRSTRDVDRPGQGMNEVQVATHQVRRGCRRRDLAVEGVAGLDLDFLAEGCFEHRRDRLVPAVVALLRLLGEAFRVIDGDAFHGRPPRCGAEAMHNPCPWQAAPSFAANGQPTNSDFGIIAWMPLTPSTTCVTAKSTAMLASA